MGEGWSLFPFFGRKGSQACHPPAPGQTLLNTVSHGEGEKKKKKRPRKGQMWKTVPSCGFTPGDMWVLLARGVGQKPAVGGWDGVLSPQPPPLICKVHNEASTFFDLKPEWGGGRQRAGGVRAERKRGRGGFLASFLLLPAIWTACYILELGKVGGKDPASPAGVRGGRGMREVPPR